MLSLPAVHARPRPAPAARPAGGGPAPGRRSPKTHALRLVRPAPPPPPAPSNFTPARPDAFLLTLATTAALVFLGRKGQESTPALAAATSVADTATLPPPPPPIRTKPPPPPTELPRVPATPPLDLLREQAAAAALTAKQLAALGTNPKRVEELEALAAQARAALAAAERAGKGAAAASSAAGAVAPLPPPPPPPAPPQPVALDLPALLAKAHAALSPDAEAAEGRLLAAAAQAEAALLAAEAGRDAAAVDAAAAALADADGALEDLYAAALPPSDRQILEAAATAAAVAGGEAAALFGPARSPLQERARAAALAAHASRIADALRTEAGSATPSAPRLAHLRRLRDATQAALWRVEQAGSGSGGAAVVEPPSLPAASPVVVEAPTPPRTPSPQPPPRRREEGGDATAGGGRAAPSTPHPPGTLRLVTGAAAIPHPAKAATGGEDAHFVSSAGLGAAGVADGVGGWAAEGVDPAIFARRLMEGAAAALEAAARKGGDAGLCVREALVAGHAATRGIPGSSTAVVAAALPGGTLRVAVLGDSGFHLLRGGRSALASDPQQHAFNMPFQLADPALGRSAANTPADADVYDVAAAAGDVLVLATDGVWDNLRPSDVEALLATFDKDMGAARSPGAAQALAARIAARAAQHGADPTYKSPWVVEAARAGALPLWARLAPRGGKMDDCTVVVGWLVEA